MAVKDKVKYDPDTGLVTWLSGKNEGKQIGCLNHQGFLVATVDYQHWTVHHLAWFIHYGTRPKKPIVHVNGDKTDNRICNLVEANKALVALTKTKQSNNTSGFKGVSLDKNSGKWVAQIRDHGTPIRIGSFVNKIDAAYAYETYAARLKQELAEESKK